MAEQRNGGIHIGQLNLRIPGDGAEAGQRIASGIGPILAERIPEGMKRHLGALSLRVQAPAGATEAALSDAVAEAIVRSLCK